MQGASFICSECHQRIEDCNSPIIIYIVASLAPMHPSARVTGTVDLTDMPMPAEIRTVLSKPRQRRDYCVGCFARVFGQPLVDAKGETVALPDEAKLHLDGATTK